MASTIDQIPVVLPWTVNPRSSDWSWAYSYLTDKGFPKKIWTHPGGSILDKDGRPVNPKNKRFSEGVEAQISYLCRFLQGSRNWVVCSSQDALYMRFLYYYLAGAWVCSTKRGVEIFDFIRLGDAVLNKDNENEKSLLEHTDLLIIPYGDSSSPGIRFAKGSILNLLIRRKEAGRPTIVDVLIRKNTDKEIGDAIMRLDDAFGSGASTTLFNTDTAKRVSVKIIKEG